jgi:hypothetical protein
MAYINSNYKPRKQGRDILDRALEHVRSVPYKVTARWLFYRLLQDGYYANKKDYKNRFIQMLSKARHNYWGGWQPDTLVDDTRAAIIKTGGDKAVDDWVQGMTSGGFTCRLDHFYKQDYYVELWFEAAAMVRQFEYYTKGVTLRPFQGQPSIPYKYEIAKSLREMRSYYGKEIVILYFGDYDAAGLAIQNTAEADIRGWCGRDFELIRCGLNEGDGERLGIPENFEHPGSYQWEALDDAQARDLITTSVNKYVDKNIVSDTKAEGAQAGKILDDFLGGFAEYYEHRMACED